MGRFGFIKGRRERAHAADASLAQRAAAGDADARQELTRRLECVPRFLRQLDRSLGSALGDEDLQDLAQDVHAVVWSKLASFEGRARFETWVHRIASFELRSAARRKWVQKDRTESGARDAMELDEREGQPMNLDSEEFEGLRLAMASLSPEEESILRIRFHEGLTFDQIGERVGQTASGVKYHYYAALERLRRIIRVREGGE